MFYGTEKNTYVSKGITVNILHKLITAKILKAPGNIQSQAKANIVIFQ